MQRADKNREIERIHGHLAGAGSVFLVDMTGLKVPQVTDFRRRIKAASGTCRVVKNRLAARAVKGTPAEVLAGRFRGPIGIVTHPTDPIALAKILADFAKEHPSLAMRAAALEGRVAEPVEVARLATLPGFQELRAILLGVLSAPATKLVRLLATPGTQLARALDARRKKIEADS